VHSPDYDRIEKENPAYQPIHDHQAMIEKVNRLNCVENGQVFPDPKVPGKAYNR